MIKDLNIEEINVVRKIGTVLKKYWFVLTVFVFGIAVSIVFVFVPSYATPIPKLKNLVVKETFFRMSIKAVRAGRYGWKKEVVFRIDGRLLTLAYYGNYSLKEIEKIGTKKQFGKFWIKNYAPRLIGVKVGPNFYISAEKFIEERKTVHLIVYWLGIFIFSLAVYCIFLEMPNLEKRLKQKDVATPGETVQEEYASYLQSKGASKLAVEKMKDRHSFAFWLLLLVLVVLGVLEGLGYINLINKAPNWKPGVDKAILAAILIALFGLGFWHYAHTFFMMFMMGLIHSKSAGAGSIPGFCTLLIALLVFIGLFHYEFINASAIVCFLGGVYLFLAGIIRLMPKEET